MKVGDLWARKNLSSPETRISVCPVLLLFDRHSVLGHRFSLGRMCGMLPSHIFEHLSTSGVLVTFSGSNLTEDIRHINTTILCSVPGICDGILLTSPREPSDPQRVQ
jgi:hypothetical protein